MNKVERSPRDIRLFDVRYNKSNDKESNKIRTQSYTYVSFETNTFNTSSEEKELFTLTHLATMVDFFVSSTRDSSHGPFHERLTIDDGSGEKRFREILLRPNLHLLRRLRVAYST